MANHISFSRFDIAVPPFQIIFPLKYSGIYKSISFHFMLKWKSHGRSCCSFLWIPSFAYPDTTCCFVAVFGAHDSSYAIGITTTCSPNV
jgi:hypothetical protein